MSYRTLKVNGGAPIKAWIEGVPFDPGAERQLRNTARLPIIHKWIAAMPDVHQGIGATIGSVIPTRKAIIPAAVGVDLGCGVMAVRTSLDAAQLPDRLDGVRAAIEQAVPHGRTDHGGRNDRGAWRDPPPPVAQTWGQIRDGFTAIVARHPKIAKANHLSHLGTLGTGNHFIEVCLDQRDRVWFMLHSGSRGVGARIGTYFIELAKNDMRRHTANLPDRDLAYLQEGSVHFDDYIAALSWAQNYARLNRELMMTRVVQAVAAVVGAPFEARLEAVDCHHNYAQRERHFGEDVWVTRKGAVSARQGQLGIIPGSMGARSYIVRGKGAADSFQSCSHGAGRAMSRREAKRRFTIDQHAAATRGVACRKDADVLDETPAAYKDIDAVIEAQRDLIDVVHTLKQVVCVKG